MAKASKNTLFSAGCPGTQKQLKTGLWSQAFDIKFDFGFFHNTEVAAVTKTHTLTFWDYISYFHPENVHITNPTRFPLLLDPLIIYLRQIKACKVAIYVGTQREFLFYFDIHWCFEGFGLG